MQVVREALILRSWALRVLSTGWSPPPDVPTDAWRLFLRAERCAVALSIRAEGDAPPVLHATATVELQRILSARGQVEELGRSAARLGLRVMVLKGGLLALQSGTAPTAAAGVDLDDVDVLTERGHEQQVASFLDRNGYHAVAGDGPVHLGGRGTPNAVPIEVHFHLRELGDADGLWRRARAISGHQGLWRLDLLDHARHVLFHAVKTHPSRRSRLRDLLLIGRADGELDPGGRAALDRLVEEDDARPLLARTLDAARHLAWGSLTRDHFTSDAAAHYLLVTPVVSRLDLWLGGHVGRSVFARLSGPDARREYWRSQWDGGSPRSPWRFLAAVEERSPRAGGLLRRLLRLLRLPAIEAVAVRVARRAVRLGQAHDKSPATTRAIRSGDA